ncbi:hypothetical protein [Streptomyces sp. NPDC005009]
MSEDENGMTAGRRRKVAEMIRLALAVWEPGDAERLPEAMVRPAMTSYDGTEPISGQRPGGLRAVDGGAQELQRHTDGATLGIHSLEWSSQL